MGDIGTTSGFYSARPSIRLDGQAEPRLSDGLLSLLIEETTAGLYRCEASFGNWGNHGGGVGFLYFDRAVLDFGKPFAVKAGDGEAAATLFEGRILGIEARFPQGRSPEIAVLAEDRFQDLRMNRRTRTFEDVSDRDVFEQIASEHSLQAEVDVDGPTHRVLAQVNQSDLAFLRSRARVIDAEVWVEASTLHAQARGRRDAGRLTLTYRQGLYEFSALADLAEQRTSLTVSGWDVETKEGIAHEAAEPAIRSELNGFQSGAAVLEAAFGPRTERIVHLTPVNDDEARVAAEAQFRTMARRFVTGRGLAEGDGRLRVGASVELLGVGALFEGRYTVTEVRHTFDGAEGFRTTFAVERPGINPR